MLWKMVAEPLPTDHRPPHPAMPRFSLKTLLISTALISVGLGVIIVTFSSPPPKSFGNVALAAYSLSHWFGGGALIGAGVMLPWNKPWLGVALSVPIQIILFFVLAFLAVWFGGVRLTD
jgi:hypothetical protein